MEKDCKELDSLNKVSQEEMFLHTRSEAEENSKKTERNLGKSKYQLCKKALVLKKKIWKKMEKISFKNEWFRAFTFFT